MKINKITSVALCLVFLASCKSTTFLPSAEKQTYIYEPLPVKTFTFIKATNGLNGVQVNDVRSKTINELNRLSSWGGCGSSLCSEYSSSGLTDKWGTKTKIDNNSFNLDFINGQVYSNTNSFRKSTTSTSFQFDITENEEKITLTLHSARSADFKPERNAIGIPYYPLLNEEKLKSRIELIFNNFTKPTITKTGHHKVKGEFNVPFDPASVITNFERLATRYNNKQQTTERTYKDSFTLKIDGKLATVNLEVFLYRGKSKVNYLISYPYEVFDNGKHTSDSGKALDAFEKKVKEIANS